MHIVVDEAVSLAQELLGPFGRLTVLPAREIVAERLRGADALVVRSGVRVGRELLAGTGVRFVGTATAGTDHIDEAWLREAGIAFASAPGCNARAVGEWVVAVLLAIGERMGVEWDERVLGVVGVGHVGRIVAELGGVLGMRVLLCDPPRARAEGAGAFVELEPLLRQADVVSLHVPLTRGGAVATWRMMDARRIVAMRHGAVLINASRGEVVETAAMISARRTAKLAALACDVWELEPRIDEGLLDVADIMTPHIAGYSLEGKVAGTRMVAEALGRFFGSSGLPQGQPELEGGAVLVASLGQTGCDLNISDYVKSVYDVMADDRRLREGVRSGGGGPETLRKLRREYPLRREFASYQVVKTISVRPAAACRLQDRLRRLGFGVVESPENPAAGRR